MPPPLSPAHNNFQTADVAVTYRFEPIAVENDVTPSVCANVHDALWMLTQQWRVFEFKGEDAGSVIKARVETESARLSRYQSGSNPVEAYNHKVPLETQVEGIPLILDLGTRFELGFQWYKILQRRGLGSTFSSFITAFPVEQYSGTNRYDIQSNSKSVVARKIAQNRMVDGGRLYLHLKKYGTLVPESGIPSGNTADIQTLTNAQNDFIDWINLTYFMPANANDDTWKESQLEYKFKVSAQPTGSQDVLEADRYKSGTVDWYSVDWNPGATLQESPQGSIVIPQPETKIESYLTHKIRWKGMPKGRWWEFEDRNVDLAKMLTQKQDILKLILMEFGLIYSNDWFVIPHDLDNGTVTEIKGMVITDSFGQRLIVSRAGTGDDYDWQKWDMFQVNQKGQPASGYSLNKLLLMPALMNRVESEPIEKVLFLRDDMANMIWGVEDVVPNDLFGGVSGKLAAGDLQDYLEKHHPLAPIVGQVPTPTTHRYRLQSPVPENWIPFVTAPTNITVGNRGRLVQRGRMVRFINGQDDSTPIEPRTSILRRHLDDKLPNGLPNPGPYFVHQEEVSKSGFDVTTTYQRARWYDGNVFTWLGRKKQTGRGESGLHFAFDYLDTKEAEEPITPPTPPAPTLPLPGASAWFRSDSGITALNGEVEAWADQSGNDNHLTALSTLAQPTYFTSGGPNDHPYLQFTGSEGLVRAVFDLASTQNLTIFAVFRSTDSTHPGILAELTANTGSNADGLYMSTNDGGANILGQGHKGNGGWNVSNAKYPFNTWNYVRFEAWKSQSPLESLTYVNSGPAGSLNPWGTQLYDNSNTFATNAAFSIGCRSGGNGAIFLKGELAELLVYPSALSTADIATVESYLSNRYSVPAFVYPAVTPVGWWKADAGITTVSGQVSNWVDQSGVGSGVLTGNDLVATSTILRPTYNPYGGPANKPYLSFNGAQALYIPTFNIGATADLTIFAVMQNNEANDIGLVLEMTTNTNSNATGQFLCINNSGSGTLDIGVKGNAGYSLNSTTFPLNTWKYVRAEGWKSRPTNEAQIYVNGAGPGTQAINSSNSNNFATASPIYIGSRTNNAFFFKGKLSELIIYSGMLSGTDITSIENYLKTKYDL